MAKAMSKETINSPSADSLAEAAKKAQGKGLPPIHQWTPDFSGDLDMRIARDGTWFHEGTPINREGLVRLFSTILKMSLLMRVQRKNSKSLTRTFHS